VNLSLGALFLGIAAGAALGGLYFGGLWLTAGRLTRHPRPGLLLGLSFAVRLALALAVFSALVSVGWVVSVAALAGFLLARLLWVKAARAGTARRSSEAG
jgi:F1F0 ATPase subunit 2